LGDEQKALDWGKKKVRVRILKRREGYVWILCIIKL